MSAGGTQRPGVRRPDREESPAPELDPQDFRDVIGHFASGVTVITAAVDGQRLGTTASAVSSLSLEPPMVLICMNRTSTTGQAITRSRAFAINILTEEQGDLAQHFASKDPDKFESVDASTGPFGQPLLADALATIECEVAEEVAGGTHTVFLAEVRSATSRDGAPLAYFRGQFGRLELAQDQHIYVTLRERLLARKLAVGRDLQIKELTDALHAPAAPLFYALGRLSTEGLLSRTRDGGFVVPPITWAAVEEAVDACCAMELGALTLSIGSVPPERLAELRAAMEPTVAHVREGRFVDMDRSIDDNSRFHETLVGLAESEPLLDAYRRVALPGILVRALEPRVAGTQDERFGEDHREMVEALEQGDAPAARQAVVRHADRIKGLCRAAIKG